MHGSVVAIFVHYKRGKSNSSQVKDCDWTIVAGLFTSTVETQWKSAKLSASLLARWTLCCTNVYSIKLQFCNNDHKRFPARLVSTHNATLDESLLISSNVVPANYLYEPIPPHISFKKMERNFVIEQISLAVPEDYSGVNAIWTGGKSVLKWKGISLGLAFVYFVYFVKVLTGIEFWTIDSSDHWIQLPSWWINQ